MPKQLRLLPPAGHGRAKHCLAGQTTARFLSRRYLKPWLKHKRDSCSNRAFWSRHGNGSRWKTNAGVPEAERRSIVKSDRRLRRPSSSITEKFCAIGPRQEIARRGRPAPFAPRAGKSPPQSASVFLLLKSSKKTCAHSTSRHLRLRDYSHRYWRMGDGGRRLGVLLGTAGIQVR